jgi:ribose-phosphate pyrophosphokinase
VIVMVTHGVLAGTAPEELQASPCIDEVVVTNTVPQEKHQARCAKLTVIRCEGVLAETIRRVHNDECMSSKFCNQLELA